MIRSAILFASSIFFVSLNPDAHAEFDASRYSTAGEGRFETFHITSTQPLAEALAAGVVGSETELLIANAGGAQLALIKDQMAFHHIAQGQGPDKDWMATF